MSPPNDRSSGLSETSVAQSESEGHSDDEALENAAQALREVEVEAVQSEDSVTDSSTDSSQLESMSIDELRALAGEFDVPNRGQIIERDELIAAIRQRC